MGVEGYPLEVTIVPDRIREKVSRCCRGKWAVRSPNHVAPESEGRNVNNGEKSVKRKKHKMLLPRV